MRAHSPFYADDLEELDSRLLSTAARVIAMEDAHDGDKAANTIALRHDCDSAGSLDTAARLAEWEAERGYRSSYYILHTSPYWGYTKFPRLLDEIAGYGHEIGIHSDAIAESLITGEDPDIILDRAVTRLRDLGHQIRGVAGHGNAICNRSAGTGEPWFSNDEQFLECRRTHMNGEPMPPADRLLWRGKIRRQLSPRPLAHFGLEYEALWLSVPFYFRLSDSGGSWKDEGFDKIAQTFAGQTEVTAAAVTDEDPMQLHVLQHPDWWGEAFVSVGAAA